jgi:hypothetical protein
MSGPIRDFEPTMSSMEMVDFINADRKERATAEKPFTKLEHSDLIKKVPRVLGGDAGKFSGVYSGKNGQDRPCYYFPKREACLMAMSYSYELQAKVWDRMVALEAELSRTRLSSHRDRLPLHHAALNLVSHTGILFSAAHKINNAVAGTKHYRDMTLEKLDLAIPICQRISDGTASKTDHALLEKGMREVFGETPQLPLGLDDPDDSG